MTTQPGFGLLGCLGVAVIVVLIAAIMYGPRLSVTKPPVVDSSATATAANPTPIRLAYRPPGEETKVRFCRHGTSIW